MDILWNLVIIQYFNANFNLKMIQIMDFVMTKGVGFQKSDDKINYDSNIFDLQPSYDLIT